MARRRLGIAPVRHVFEAIVHPLARPETPWAFYRLSALRTRSRRSKNAFGLRNRVMTLWSSCDGSA
jgi:hypothetical protein